MPDLRNARRENGIRSRRRWLRLEPLEERALLVAGLTSEGNQYWHQNVALVEESGEDGDEFGGALATGDFNGDDYQDLAVGVPGESVAGHLEAGAVNVIYGSFAGLSATNSQLWHQDIENILADAETGDRFGTALAVGDFNNDGYDDLAIGVPGDEINGASNAGGVNVIYGSRSGLNTQNDQFWYQSLPDVFGDSERDDNFGASLTVGDFNGDRYDDLAIGVPGEAIDGAAGAGAVNVVYGAATGLTTGRDQRWHQNIPDVKGDSETGDGFGASLAAGDFDGDGYDDLAIGVPEDEVEGSSNAGGVNVVYGTRDGLATANDQLWYQSLAEVDGESQSNERFGAALVAGEFNGDRFVDLAIGVPGESVEGAHNSGAVNVIYGSRNRLTPDNAQFWHQDVLGIKDQVEAGDRFGESLTAGDFDGDRVDDLAVGAPGESLGNFSEAGAVSVIFGSQLGLTENNNQFWSQESFDVQGAANANEHFGNALAAGNFDRDSFADLAIGVPFDTVNGGLTSRFGAVNVLYGATISPAQVVIEMQGPGGYDPPNTSETDQQRFVTTDGYLEYRIEVWNDSVAEVAAKAVKLRDGFSDPELLDLDSFELTRIGFLDWDRPLAESQQFETRVDLRPGWDLLVDVTASVDWDDVDGDGNVTWELSSIDPATGVAPDDLLRGVLPPLNPATGREIAWFEYRVKPKADLATGTRIENQAFGEFDNYGDWPIHPAPSFGPWLNTIDSGPPDSQIADLPDTSPARVELRWTGADDAGGSGIAHYDIFVSEEGQPFQLWLDDTNETSAIYQGLPDHTYAFYSVATDNVGHQEAPPDSADVTTFVQATPAEVVVTMIGPEGYDPEGTSDQQRRRFVSADEYLGYRIEIWNEPTAETAAKLVTGRDALANPDNFAFSTIEFTRIGFGQWVQILGGVQEFSTRVELGPDAGFVVDVAASVDMDDLDGDGNIKWEFRSIDPSTGEAPEDRLEGVLPPYDVTSQTDMAWFEFRVKPKSDLPTGMRMENRAFGEFDNTGDWLGHAAPPIGPWVNTIDAGAPVSQVEALPPSSPEMFEVLWTGNDDENGSGVATFDVYASENGQPFELWLDDTADTSSVYQGQPGRTYRFYSVASDHVGNAEPSPAAADAVTRVIVEDEKWRNPDNALDVSADGFVSPLDALLIINHLNDNPGNSSLPAPPAVPPPFLDVSGDLLVSPLDALLVINFLNAAANSEVASADGELDSAYKHQDGTDAAAFSAGVSALSSAEPELDRFQEGTESIVDASFQHGGLVGRVSVVSTPVPSRGAAAIGTGVIVSQAIHENQRVSVICADVTWQLGAEFDDVIAESDEAALLISIAPSL